MKVQKIFGYFFKKKPVPPVVKEEVKQQVINSTNNYYVRHDPPTRADCIDACIQRGIYVVHPWN